MSSGSVLQMVALCFWEVQWHIARVGLKWPCAAGGTVLLGHAIAADCFISRGSICFYFLKLPPPGRAGDYYIFLLSKWLFKDMLGNVAQKKHMAFDSL